MEGKVNRWVVDSAALPTLLIGKFSGAGLDELAVLECQSIASSIKVEASRATYLSKIA